MRSISEQMQQIKRQARNLSRARQRRIDRRLGGSCLLLLCAISLLIGRSGGTASVQGLYGATLLAGDAGGYVLVAVLCFIAAVCITLACLRRKKRRARENTSD